VKYLKKIITGSLVIALTLFAGSFCLHPMQAAAASMDCHGCLSSGDELTSASTTCTSDCVTTAPQTVSVKKVVVDNAHNFIAAVSTEQNAQPLELHSEWMTLSGTDPPAPDILSSVVKIE
jgi:hypothetical protein